MKKKVLKMFSVVLGLSFFILFVACNPYKEVDKASKGLTNYTIDMKLDVSDMSFDVSQNVEVVNQTNVILNNICFNMYAKAFREDAKFKPYTSVNQDKCFPNGVDYGDLELYEVKENGKDANYGYVGEDNNAIKINLSKELEPEQKVKIKMSYKLKLANCVHRLGYHNGAINLGNFYPILAVYQKGDFVVDPYYSTGDPFYSQISNYNITISYPEEYVLSSTGYNVSKNKENGFINQTLEALAVRDFAINLTKDAEVQTRKVGDVLLSYVGYKGDSNISECLNICEEAVEFYNHTFGKYPYKKLDVVKTGFVHGGMEYPSMVTISDSYTDDFDIAKVISHEIAHQWWYGVVGNNQISEAWLDEGLTEYSSILFLANQKKYDVSYEELISEAFANYVLYVDIIDTINGKLNSKMNLRVNEYSSEYEYSYMVYTKSVLMFDTISQLIGKNKLEKALKTYYKKYKFKIATTDDLIACFINSSNRDVGGVFDSWLNGKTVIGTIN